MANDFNKLAKHFADADAARDYLEAQRWANGVFCPHCGSKDAYKLTPKSESKSPVRKGVHKCKTCRKQFTVTVGTIFEDSRIPLNKWLYAVYMMCSSKKGVSAHQLHRTLGITYKSAWFMVHRIRFAMSQSPLVEKMSGEVEVDETYVGGKPRKGNNGENKKPSKRGRGTDKTPVVVVVERDGQSRAKKMKQLSAKNLREYIQENVTEEATVNTDGYSGYNNLDKHFPNHEVVDHNSGEFARGRAYTNTAESWFSLLKRGVYGTFHHVSEKHLDRYVDEFVFRWNNRKISDLERTIIAIHTVGRKRLMYKQLIK